MLDSTTMACHFLDAMYSSTMSTILVLDETTTLLASTIIFVGTPATSLAMNFVIIAMSMYPLKNYSHMY